jgi:hypothetical protein
MCSAYGVWRVMTKKIIKSFKNNPDSCQQALASTTSVLGRIDTISKKGLLNYVVRTSTSLLTYTGTTSRPGTLIADLSSTITTSVNNSYIVYDLNMFYEVFYDVVFVLLRTANGIVTEIASGNPSGAAAYGFAGAKYDHNNQDSTGSQTIYKFVDTPNVVAGTPITYQIRFYGSAAHVFHLNRTVNGTNSYAYEDGISTVILTEIGL